MPKILVVDDEPSVLSVLSSMLRKEDYEVVPRANGEEALEELRKQEFDLILTDIHMAPVDGIELLHRAHEMCPNTPVVLLTGYGSVKTAVEAMKGGAFDYCTKPFKMDELLATLQRALKYRALLLEREDLRSRLRQTIPSLVAESAAMRQICEVINRVAPTDSTVLIIGESGTGKEVVARAIHDQSLRRKKSFVPINCAAMPEPLLESEMFGHVKGAFTGAVSDKQGLFEAADGGTIFLDEIGAMPPSIQAKFLRVLQDKTIRKVGGTESYPVDVRVVAATNEPLENRIARGLFREDLYYRLSVIPIRIPPLRERREDILPLVSYVLRRERPAGAPIPKLDPRVEWMFEHYSWPGNVRELENAVRHALTFMRGDTITPDVLPARIVNATAATAPGSATHGEPSPDEFRGRSLKAFLRQKEREYVKMVVDRMGGDKEAAAVALKISLTTLYRKLANDEE
ncbi:MAG: sigma-54 dependent transcriptional regulator [Kiritimatiellae bacterium]|nr:sigma-54 dependent transcriptional regulator [Kiritimatiellia bacterium]